MEDVDVSFSPCLFCFRFKWVGVRLLRDQGNKWGGNFLGCIEMRRGLFAWVGLVMPSPPRRAGKARRSLYWSLKGFWPVSDGRKCCRMVVSSGFIMSSMFGIVLDRYVHLLARPWVNAAYAACGWVTAMDDRCFTSSIQPETFFWT